MVLDPIPQPLPVHVFGSRPQPPTSQRSPVISRKSECPFRMLSVVCTQHPRRAHMFSVKSSIFSLQNRFSRKSPTFSQKSCSQEEVHTASENNTSILSVNSSVFSCRTVFSQNSPIFCKKSRMFSQKDCTQPVRIAPWPFTMAANARRSHTIMRGLEGDSMCTCIFIDAQTHTCTRTRAHTSSD